MAENAKEREATASGGVEESAALERKCAWRSEWLLGYQCKERVGEAGQLCILHSPDAKKNREEFRARVEEKRKAGDFDFLGTFFPEEVRFSGELKQANFFEARFQGDANFVEARVQGAASFRGARFQGAASFLEARFQGAADFSVARFQGAADFSRAEFRDFAQFTLAKFRDDVNFHQTLFGLRPGNRPAVFADAVFEKQASFDNAQFCSGADFDSARFLGDCGFRWALFRGHCDFLETRFTGSVYFERNYVDGILDFGRAEFLSVLSLRGPFQPVLGVGDNIDEEVRRMIESGLRFEDILLEQAEGVRFEELDLRNTTFAGSNVRGVEFRNVIWPKTVWGKRLTGRTFDELQGVFRRSQRPLLDKLWSQLLLFLSHNTAADEWRGSADHERARRVCRDLKASLEDQRDYADAGDFYYAEMELRRRQVGPVRWFLYWLYWLVCGYGEKPLRALVVFLALWLALGGGFQRTWFTAQERVKWRVEHFDSRKEFQPSWNEALGHSIRSLTLQQRGTYLVPFSAGAVRLTLLANVVGPIQLGLFFLAMRRRFRR